MEEKTNSKDVYVKAILIDGKLYSSSFWTYHNPIEIPIEISSFYYPLDLQDDLGVICRLENKSAANVTSLSKFSQDICCGRALVKLGKMKDGMEIIDQPFDIFFKHQVFYSETKDILFFIAEAEVNLFNEKRARSMLKSLAIGGVVGLFSGGLGLVAGGAHALVHKTLLEVTTTEGDYLIIEVSRLQQDNIRLSSKRSRPETNWVVFKEVVKNSHKKLANIESFFPEVIKRIERIEQRLTKYLLPVIIPLAICILIFG